MSNDHSSPVDALPISGTGTLAEQAALLRALREGNRLRATALDTQDKDLAESSDLARLSATEATGIHTIADGERLARLSAIQIALKKKQLSNTQDRLSRSMLATTPVAQILPPDQLGKEISAVAAAVEAAVGELNKWDIKQDSVRWVKVAGAIGALLLATFGLWWVGGNVRAEGSYSAAATAVATGNLSAYATQITFMRTTSPGYRATDVATLDAQWNAQSTRQSRPATLAANVPGTNTPAPATQQPSPSAAIRTAQPTPTFEPPSTPTQVATATPTPCLVSNPFGLLPDKIGRLGCSARPVYGRQVIVQRFERGVMVVFAKDSNTWDKQPGAIIYVLALPNRAWRIVDGFRETSTNPDSWYACQTSPGQRPEQSGTPWRGFGLAWCSNRAIQNALGRALSAEEVGIVADFVAHDRGQAFRLSDWKGFPGWTPGRAYTVILDEALQFGTWE